jgi:hypothetical protein
VKRQIPVDRDKDVEFGLRKSEQFSVADPTPAMSGNSCYNVPRKVFSQAAVNALIEQDSHAASVTARAAPRSKNAITCSRVTVGNPARKSSMVSPASK